MNLRPKNLKPKCVHVVCINNWNPKLTRYTLPLIRHWAKKIGADFNLITKPKFKGYPPNYERLQIYEAGKKYFWNINIDADYMVHPNMEDPTEGANPYVVMTEGRMDTDAYFRPNMYFLRDGRNQSLGDSFVVSSVFTHDIWEPLSVAYNIAKKECLQNDRQVSEFCLSLNAARYGLRYDGAIRDKSNIHHIGSTTHVLKNKKYDPVAVARDFVKKWRVAHIIEKFQKK